VAIPLLMPKLGLTMESGTVAVWLKNEGDAVVKDETIVEVETDKITTEVKSPGDGVLLKILIPAGSEANVQEVIAVVGKQGEDISGFLSIEGKTSSQIEVSLAPSSSRGGISETEGTHQIRRTVQERPFSPRARRLIAERGISAKDVSIPGTGPISEAELLRYLETESPAGGSDAIVGKQPEELSTVQKAIADRMSESFRNIPQFSIRIIVNMEPALRMLNSLNSGTDSRISINSLLLRGVAIALSRFSDVQHQYRSGRIFRPQEINIGFAVSVDNALFVPVVPDADKKRISHIAEEAAVLSSRAREHRLSVDDVSGATFTVSNLGMFGVTSFVPIINPGEAAILGVGAVQEGYKMIEGKISVERHVELTLVCDHRSVNGSVGAHFCRVLRGVFEQADQTPW